MTVNNKNIQVWLVFAQEDAKKSLAAATTISKFILNKLK